jgi:hypothetical protein
MNTIAYHAKGLNIQKHTKIVYQKEIAVSMSKTFTIPSSVKIL